MEGGSLRAGMIPGMGGFAGGVGWLWCGGAERGT